ncbi:MAG: hypothetical protein IJ187_01240 [Neisseriaceae bacterium]|nr:hypothetical protein [Neisseriaceae bacterium]
MLFFLKSICYCCFLNLSSFIVLYDFSNKYIDNCTVFIQRCFRQPEWWIVMVVCGLIRLINDISTHY